MSQESASSFSSHGHSHEDSGLNQIAAFTVKEREFQTKLDYLNDNFDED